VVEMRVLVRATALGLLMSLALAGHAAAELAPRIASPPLSALAGPVFAGDGFVWGRQAKGGYEVVTMRGDERTITHVAIPDLADARRHYLGAEVEASDRRVVLVMYAAGCFTAAECARHGSTVAYSAVLTGPVGGDLDVVGGCTSRADCAAPPCRPGSADVAGDAIAYADCQGTHVRDFAPGASPASRDFPGRTAPRIAGPYLAAAVAEGTVKVANWKTGDDVYSVSEAREYDVQDDGKLAFSHGDDVAWASSSEPFPHVVASPFPPADAVRMAADRIAAIHYNPPYDDLDHSYHGYTLEVYGLDDHPDGNTQGFFEEQALGGMDFDGTRVLWADHACRHAWLIAGDADTLTTAGAPPGLCPLPSVVRGSAHFAADHSLRLKLRCEVPPGPGCVGYVRRVGRHGRPLTVIRYSIAEGHTKTVEFPRNGSLCRAGRHRAYAKLLLSGNETRIVTARGPMEGVPRC
jgi:hypothetical protein